MVGSSEPGAGLPLTRLGAIIFIKNFYKILKGTNMLLLRSRLASGCVEAVHIFIIDRESDSYI